MSDPSPLADPREKEIRSWPAAIPKASKAGEGLMRLSSLVASSWADEAGRALPTDAGTGPDLPDWGEADRAAGLEAADLSTDDLGAAGLEAAFAAVEDFVVAGLEAFGREAACLAGVRSEAFLAADGLLVACPVCAAAFSVDLTDPAEP